MYSIQRFKLSLWQRAIAYLRVLPGKSPRDLPRPEFMDLLAAPMYFTNLWYEMVGGNANNVFPRLWIKTPRVGVIGDLESILEHYVYDRPISYHTPLKVKLVEQPWSIGPVWLMGLNVGFGNKWLALTRLRDTGEWTVVGIESDDYSQSPTILTVEGIAHLLRPDTSYDALRHEQLKYQNRKVQWGRVGNVRAKPTSLG
jgi:hypothetical protein